MLSPWSWSEDGIPLFTIRMENVRFYQTVTFNLNH